MHGVFIFNSILVHFDLTVVQRYKWIFYPEGNWYVLQLLCVKTELK